jgi:hypothetical protein
MKPSDEGCATSHRLKWGPFPSNEVGRIAKHVRDGEGRKEGKDEVAVRNIRTSVREPSMV